MGPFVRLPMKVESLDLNLLFLQKLGVRMKALCGGLSLIVWVRMNG